MIGNNFRGLEYTNHDFNLRYWPINNKIQVNNQEPKILPTLVKENRIETFRLCTLTRCDSVSTIMYTVSTL